MAHRAQGGLADARLATDQGGTAIALRRIVEPIFQVGKTSFALEQFHSGNFTGHAESAQCRAAAAILDALDKNLYTAFNSGL